jgi:hypothetical protein
MPGWAQLTAEATVSREPVVQMTMAMAQQAHDEKNYAGCACLLGQFQQSHLGSDYLAFVSHDRLLGYGNEEPPPSWLPGCPHQPNQTVRSNPS